MGKVTVRVHGLRKIKRNYLIKLTIEEFDQIPIDYLTPIFAVVEEHHIPPELKTGQ